ncbi:hypothetical protein KOI35_09250 [Actinoplanes bogorensis]|uniref:Uncharacterized protein n=1 Tax=Paractinoplanes bogorensis TaxID=1610840 RepID=A0ABS5YJU8_9ACTN|nr:hypothetical protein [Actinoplanes bogorensis]MBU2663692.1 hypothetical protein [Actinoplanes bogorensis]
MTRIRRALIVAGALVTAYGLAGVLFDPGVLLFLAAVVVFHDLVWMPVVLAFGALVARPVARFVAIVAASVLVVGVPLVVAQPPAGNPSVLPLDYGRNLLFVLAALLAAAVLVAAYRRRRRVPPRGR